MQHKYVSLLVGLAVSLFGANRAQAVMFQGSFTPTPACSTTDVCSGAGTANFSYGQPASTGINNSLNFSGATYPNIPTGSFSTGTLTIRNGAILTGTYPAFSNGNDNITFINLAVSDTANTKAGNFLLGYNSTINNDPVLRSTANADFVYFPLNPEYGAFYILEGFTIADTVASVNILAEDPPAILNLRGFQAISGQTNGFLGALPPGRIDPTTKYFIPNATGSTSVPEPFTIVGTLIGGTVALRLRKKLQDTKSS